MYIRPFRYEPADGEPITLRGGVHERSLSELVHGIHVAALFDRLEFLEQGGRFLLFLAKLGVLRLLPRARREKELHSLLRQIRRRVLFLTARYAQTHQHDGEQTYDKPLKAC